MCAGTPRSADSRVQGRQADGLVLQLATHGPGQRLERLERDLLPSCFHVPATCPSTRNVGADCGFFVWKISGRNRSGRIWVRRACTSSVASKVGRKRTGAGASGPGSGAPRTSSQLAAFLVSEPSQRQPLDHRCQHRRGQAREARDVLARGGPERREVSTHQELAPGGGASRSKARSSLRRRVAVGSAHAPTCPTAVRARSGVQSPTPTQSDAARPSASRISARRKDRPASRTRARLSIARRRCHSSRRFVVRNHQSRSGSSIAVIAGQ